VVYLFDMDGEFWLDPGDDERIPNSWGSEYSVRHIAATPKRASRPRANTDCGTRFTLRREKERVSCQRLPTWRIGVEEVMIRLPLMRRSLGPVQEIRPVCEIREQRAYQ